LKKDCCKHFFDFCEQTRGIEMKDIETFGTEDMMRIFGLSRTSIYRRLREARAGRGGLPLPIPTGAKRSLRWNAEDVEKFMQSANDQPQTSPTLEIESVSQRQKRHNAAMKKLERFGIKAKIQ
jgi:predicted DNA-binding transcriptional regulator AlpA